MSYLARITQHTPTAVVLLVDQSGSMSEPVSWNGQTVAKAQAVAAAINTLLAELIARSRRDGGFQTYYDIAVIGYSGSEVRSLLPSVGDEWFLTPEELADNPVERRDVQRVRTLPDGRQVATVMRENVWVRPSAEWNTPMVAAFTEAHRLLKRWCDRHKGRPCYPPTVIHITDGEATDGGPERVATAARKLRSLSTADGNVLLINLHISGAGSEPVLFPASADELPEDRYARLLFDISSPMPALYRDEIALLRGGSAADAETVRGMGYNANMTDLVRMMNIGTATSNLLL
ncbi:MAG: VWA domain-containing protein [Rikenella sp.]|nr:VWA domain-containing protein [Rikenella sp.]